MRTLSLLALVLIVPEVGAQTAADRYHEAARLFVAGDDGAAARAAEAGLALAPADPKLRALLAAIRQQRPPQQSRAGEQDRHDRRNQHGQQGQSDAQDREGRPSQPGAAEPPRDRPPPSPAAPRPSARRPEASGRLPNERTTAPSQRMTREEAERLLRAAGANERATLRDVQRRRTPPRAAEKDW